MGIRTTRTGIGKNKLVRTGLSLAFVFYVSLTVPAATPAQAAGFCPAPGYCSTNGPTGLWWIPTLDFTAQMKQYLLNDIYENLIVRDWWENYVGPKLDAVQKSLIANNNALATTEATLVDAENANEHRRVTQELQAEAIQEYTPGENHCRFGTTMRSLAASEEMGSTASSTLSDRIQGQQLGTKDTPSGAGESFELRARLDQFKRVYCDPNDNGGQLKEICTGNDTTRYNNDVNYPKTIGLKRTLNVVLNPEEGVDNDAQRKTEEDIMALATNLYGSALMGRYTDAELNGKVGVGTRQDEFMKLRNLTAFRSVAQNSFNQIVARRTRGAPGSTDYLVNTLREIGMTDEAARSYLTDGTDEASYNAQMEVLTKKMYQSPDFYKRLMDTPENVDRQVASMSAFGLMQDRDIYQSMERQEMMLSLLLELKIRNQQRDVEKSIGTAR